MPVLSCYVDDRTLNLLNGFSLQLGRSVENLAESLISEGALNAARTGPPQPAILDLGGASIGLYERPDGSVQIGTAPEHDARHHVGKIDYLGGQPFHHALAPTAAAALKQWIGEEIEREEENPEPQGGGESGSENTKYGERITSIGGEI